jgi:PKD repeat protein
MFIYFTKQPLLSFFKKKGSCMREHPIFVSVCLALLALMMLMPAAGAAPIVDFTSNVTKGPVPLSVGFTDGTIPTPTTWSWYFGDEDYRVPWTPVQWDTGAEWTPGRGYMGLTRLPNGHIVLAGGSSNTMPPVALNDTWMSPDNGITWTLMNASSGWSPRFTHSMVALSDGSIVLMGGWNVTPLSEFYNDTWQSVDEGATWTLMNASPGWAARHAFSAVTMPDDSIILMGGHSTQGAKNDVWKSIDKGATWTLVNANAGWSARLRFDSVALPDNSIVLMGGTPTTGLTFCVNDTWRSPDQGLTWTLMNASSGWNARERFKSVALPDGNIMLMGGDVANTTGSSPPAFIFNDTWLSRDKGATWTLLNSSSGWLPRYAPRGVLTSDGSVLLVGGVNANSAAYRDMWNFNPVGSSVQNPSHVYATEGIYSVALLVHSATETNSTLKVGLINATGQVPVADFTGTPLNGSAPLTVTFTDLSTNGPTSWVWDFGDGNTTNSTVQNPVHTYMSGGLFNVSLNATNGNGFNVSTKIGYINVSGITPPTVVSDGIAIFRPASGYWYFDNNLDGIVDKNFRYGGSTDKIIAGNWTTASTGIAIFRNSTGYWYFDNNLDGIVDKSFRYGGGSDQIIKGDWQGNGTDGIAIFRPSTGYWYFDNNLDGVVDTSFRYGGINDRIIKGDWDSDGKDGIAIFRPSTGYWYFDSNLDGIVNMSFRYGGGTDRIIAGKWA